MKKVLFDHALYKVIELTTVTDETIEEALNRYSAQGWLFDQIQFVVRDSSRRPSMAFMFFTRPAEEGCQEPPFSIDRPVGCVDSADMMESSDEPSDAEPEIREFTLEDLTEPGDHKE